MLRRVALVRTDVSEERNVSFIRVTTISELETTLRRLLFTASVFPRPPLLVTLIMEAPHSYETSVFTRATLRTIPEDGIRHSHRRESLKSYIALTGWNMWRRGNVSSVRCELGFFIPEEGTLHSHRRGNLKSYIALTGWTL
jgi:hypothetical protein